MSTIRKICGSLTVAGLLTVIGVGVLAPSASAQTVSARTFASTTTDSACINCLA